MTQKNNYNPLSRLGIDNAGEDLSGITAGQVPVRLEDGTWNGIEPGTISDADMLKAVYDIGNNGIVDNSEKLGGQLPAHYHDVNSSVESLTRVFVTPTEKTAITHINREALDNVSGINTGDQDLSPYMIITDYDSDENGTVDDSEKLGGEPPASYGKSSVLDGNGIVSGIVISINSNATKIDISSGSYHVLQNGNKAFNGITGLVLTNLLTSVITYLAINPSDNSIIQKITPLTMPERRQYIIIGAAIHSNKTIVNAINNLPDVAILGLAQFNDLFDGLGNFNRYGNVISANGANLFINKSAGQLVKRGVNYANDSNNPHVIALDALVAPSNIRYRLSDSTEYTNTNAIDVNNYESSSGVRSAVPTNKYTVQRITIFSSNLIRIQYGQDTYQSMALALQAIHTEMFIQEQNIFLNGLTRAYLVVKQGTTDLTNIDNAIFVELDKFGQTTLGSGIGTTTLQQAYNNSATPEILTNSTLGALSIKRGSTADTDAIIEIVNGDSDAVLSFDASRNITAIGGDLTVKTDSQRTLFLERACYRDEYPTPLVKAGGASAPDDVAYTIGGVETTRYSFDGNATEERISGSFEIPHDYKFGGAIEVHIHWLPSTNGTGNVQWFFDWCYMGVGSAPQAETTLSVIDAVSTNQQFFHKIKAFGNLPVNGYALGDKILFTLRRTPNGANDTYADDAILEQIALHVPVDTFGSRQIYAK